MNALKIYNVVKTDNDLRKPRNKETYSVLGFMRLNGLIGETILPEDPVNKRVLRQSASYTIKIEKHWIELEAIIHSICRDAVWKKIWMKLFMIKWLNTFHQPMEM